MGCIRLNILDEQYKSCEQKMFAVKNPLTFYKTENKERSCYVFGLEIAGLRTKAIGFGGSENKNKFNGGSELQISEFSDGSGLELYDAVYRTYDPQLGRFFQTDLLTDLIPDWSTYAFAFNNPIILNDPLGLMGDSTTPGVPGVPLMPEVVVTKVKEDCKTCQPSSTKPQITPSRQPLYNGAAPLLSPPSLYPVPPSQPNPPPSLYPVPASQPNPPPSSQPNPPPRPKVAPLISLPAAALTAVFTLIPVGGPSFPNNDEGYWIRGHPVWEPFPGNGNRLNNWNPHMVYIIKFTPSDDKTPILKYGITDAYRYGTNRPESQLTRLKTLYGSSVTWSMYTIVLTREKALYVERTLVTDHVSHWGYMPRDQIKPGPF